MTIKDQQYNQQLDEIVHNPEWDDTRKRVEAGKASRKAVERLRQGGKSIAEISDLLGMREHRVREIIIDLEGPKDILEEQETIWFPGIYDGRQYEPWTTPIGYFSDNRIIALVQKRARQDGAWAIQNDFVGNNEDKMHKMMAWVGDERNICQCVEALRKEEVQAREIGNEDYEPRTVDFVCRDLANGSKWAFSRE